MKDNLRLFIAIPIAEEIRMAATQIVMALRETSWGKHIRWTRPENFHITLRFIGKCSAEEKEIIFQKTSNALKAIPPFNIYLNRVRLFPSKHKAHVIVVSIQPEINLLNLAHHLEQIVTSMGFAPERRLYVPHLTLGRLDNHHPHPTLSNDLIFPIKQFSADRVVFLHSELIDNKRIYQKLFEIALG